MLEVEPDADSHRFLETITSIANNTVRVQHSNHNGASVMQGMGLKRLNRAAPTSNITAQDVVGRLYGELHRVAANCSDDLAIVQAIAELWLELHEFGWQKKWLLTALNQYMQKDNNKVWEYIFDHIADK